MENSCSFKKCPMYGKIDAKALLENPKIKDCPYFQKCPISKPQ